MSGIRKGRRWVRNGLVLLKVSIKRNDRIVDSDCEIFDTLSSIFAVAKRV